MSYTKAPVNDTHNTIRIPIRGTPIVVSEARTNNANFTTLSYIDCFPKTEKQWGIDPVRRAHKREGWASVTVGTITTSPTTFSRSVVFCEDIDNAYAALNTGIYKIGDIYSKPTVTIEQAEVTGLTGCSGTLAVNNSNVNKVCFLSSAGYLHTWDQDGANNTTTNLSALLVDGGYGLVFLNGYLFAVATNGRIYNSSVGGNLTTWNSTDYLTPELFPDFCKHIDKHKNHLVAFSANSTEFFYDGGVEVGSPLARQESYASNIGLYDTGNTGAKVARIGDDLYFIGRSQAEQLSLYRIRNFQVEEIPNQFIDNVLNWNSTNAQVIQGIQTVIINNEPMISIAASRSYEIIYYPAEDSWWTLRTNADAGRSLPSVNTDFPGFETRVWGSTSPTIANSLSNPNRRRTTFNLSYTGTLYVNKPSTTSVQAELYTEVVDFGINFYKHIARVDAVGDFGNNVLSLLYNPTPKYDQPYVQCLPNRTPSTTGFGYNASWYNLGGHRRFSLKLVMTGTQTAMVTGFDVTYNVGAT